MCVVVSSGTGSGGPSKYRQSPGEAASCQTQSEATPTTTTHILLMYIGLIQTMYLLCGV